MGTLKAKITLTSSDISSDSINFSVENTLTVNNGGIIRTKVTGNTLSDATVLFSAGSYSYPTYLYIKNTDATATDFVHINLDPFTDSTIQLRGGEWTWIPWKAANDITVYTSNTDDNTVIEYGLFYA